jgi:hypothetical protein
MKKALRKETKKQGLKAECSQSLIENVSVGRIGHPLLRGKGSSGRGAPVSQPLGLKGASAGDARSLMLRRGAKSPKALCLGESQGRKWRGSTTLARQRFTYRGTALSERLTDPYKIDIIFPDGSMRSRPPVAPAPDIYSVPSLG